MPNHPAPLEFTASSLTATVLKLTPILLASVLVVGCSTKAQRIGSLSGDPSLAASANSKGRGGVQDSPQTGTADAATASAVGKSSSDAAVGSSGTAQVAGSGDNPGSSGADAGSNRADASSASDEASASSASEGVSGVGSSTRSGAGSNQASTTNGANGGAAAPRRPGAAGRAGASAAGASAGAPGAPGTANGGGETSSLSGNPASAGGQRAGVGGASDADGGAADLSTGGSVAGLEADAGGGPAGKTGASASRRGARPASGSTDDGTGTGGAAAAGVEGDARIAAIDVPGGKVKVDEEYRPQTLGGVLPLVLGVNEEGRFDFDQYSLRPEVKRILDELAEKLKTAEYDRLDIIGHTDRIGTSDYNRRLSELRAYAVAQYLMGRGVPENKIRYEGRGDKDPVTPAGNCQGLAREELITCLQNDRRVEIEASIHRKHATVIQ